MNGMHGQVEKLDKEILKISSRIEEKNEVMFKVDKEIEKIAGQGYKSLKESVESLEHETKYLFDDLNAKEVDFEAKQKEIRHL